MVLQYGLTLCHIPSWNGSNIMHYRYFLGVGRIHAIATAAGDMCWMPTLRRHQLQLSLMWIAITKMEEDRLCKRIYRTARHFAVNNKDWNWSSRVKEVCNLSQWWESDSCGNLSKTECKKMIVSVLFRLERAKWYKEVLSKPKLRTHRLGGLPSSRRPAADRLMLFYFLPCQALKLLPTVLYLRCWAWAFNKSTPSLEYLP